MEVFIFEKLVTTFKYLAICSTIVFVVKFIFFFFTCQKNENILNTVKQQKKMEYLTNNYIQSISAFFVTFGWGGYLMLSTNELKNFIPFIVICSIILGTIAFIFSEFFIRKMKHFYRIKNFDKYYLANRIAKIKETIYPKNKGSIRVEFDFDYIDFKNAENTSDFEMKKDEIVKITKFENDIIYLERRNDG